MLNEGLWMPTDRSIPATKAGWLHAGSTLPRVIPEKFSLNFIRDLSVYAIQNRYLLRYLNSRSTQIFISFVSRTKNRIDTEILNPELVEGLNPQ